MGELILVVDDDPDIRSVVEMTLELAGFSVVGAADGSAGIEAMREHLPDAVVLDVMMPDLNGFEVIDRIRADARFNHMPIMLLTAKAQLGDKVLGLEGGADDYLTKPFDSVELVVRVQALLRRARNSGAISPLTGLPGNIHIEHELRDRVDSGEPIALLYADLNNFKAYNDHYGFLRGDDVIGLLADALREEAAAKGNSRTFVGHIGGDDFIVITPPETAESIAGGICLAFDKGVSELYDPPDRERGFIEVRDRRGESHRYPPTTVSIGIVTTSVRDVSDHRELVELSTEMKSFAKRVSGTTSNYAIDRRADRAP